MVFFQACWHLSRSFVNLAPGVQETLNQNLKEKLKLNPTCDQKDSGPAQQRKIQGTNSRFKCKKKAQWEHKYCVIHLKGFV